MLGQKGFFATGTIRENRTSNNTIKSYKIMKKNNRGSYDYSFNNSNKILLVKWNDNSVGKVATNNDKTALVRVHSRKEKRSIFFSTISL